MLIPVRTDAAPRGRAGRAQRAFRLPADAWWVTAIAAVGAVLRFATIATQSFWVDEANTVHEMHLSFGSLLHAIATNESTPPLYYVTAWVWAKVFGTSEAGLRSLSAVAGVAAVVIAYLCGRELVSRAAGVVAAAFAAISPFMIWYSQEARAYMLFAALSGLSFLFFARTWRDAANRSSVVGWAVFSALALATHFFALLLVAAEAALLLWRARNRAIAVAVVAVAAVQAALVPLVALDTTHDLVEWIKVFPLSSRIKQVPVDFALSTLYRSAAVRQGLVGAAAVAVAVALLLGLGGERSRRRGAALAAVLAGVVILVPIALAELGHDYLVPRNLILAWIPLAVVIAAACTAPRTLPFGAALAALLLGAFVYGQIRIDREAQFQRPDWRGVAAALGRPTAPRAIVAYDSSFAAQPLSIYLPGVPWDPPPAGSAVSVGEVDVVGSTFQTPQPLPPGVRLISSATVPGGFLVERFSIAGSWHLTPAVIAARAGALLGPAPAAPAVLVQR